MGNLKNILILIFFIKYTSACNSEPNDSNLSNAKGNVD